MSDGSATPRSPFTRPGFIASAVVVAALVVALVVVLASGILNGPAPTPTGTGPSTDPEAPSASDLSVCGLEGFERTSSLDAAPENDWELVGTVAAPTSTGTGPGVVEDDGFRSCFAHTAEGALFAAVNYFSLSSDLKWRGRLPELIAPGPGREALIEAASDEPGQPSSVRIQVAGFRVSSYSEDEAVIDVAWSVTSSGGSLVSYPTALVWVDGDWKLDVLDDGSSRFASAPLQNLGGYIPWAGV